MAETAPGTGWGFVRRVHRGVVCDVDLEIRQAYERYPFPYPLDMEYARYTGADCRRTLQAFQPATADLFRLAGLAPEIVKGRVVWDLGCGVGWRAMALAREGARAVHAFDVAESALAWGRRFGGLLELDNLHFHVASLYDLDRAVDVDPPDVLVCTGTLHHVFALDRVARAIARCCRAGTTFLFTHSRYNSRLGLVKYYKNYLSWATGGARLEDRLAAGERIWSRWVHATPSVVRLHHLNDLAGVFYMARSPRTIRRTFEAAGFDVKVLPSAPPLSAQLERLRDRLATPSPRPRKRWLKRMLGVGSLALGALPLPAVVDRGLGAGAAWWLEMHPYRFRATYRGGGG